jgi:dolichyl-phosphate beta-glucosyltransferase
MLHSRGELLLMLDADGATQVTDLAKLEAQVCHKQNQIASWKKKAPSNSMTLGCYYDEMLIITYRHLRFLLLDPCLGTESWIQFSTLC